MSMATPKPTTRTIQNPLIEGGCIGMFEAYVTGGPRCGGFIFYREVANGY